MTSDPFHRVLAREVDELRRTLKKLQRSIKREALCPKENRARPASSYRTGAAKAKASRGKDIRHGSAPKFILSPASSDSGTMLSGGEESAPECDETAQLRDELRRLAAKFERSEKRLAATRGELNALGSRQEKELREAK